MKKIDNYLYKVSNVTSGRQTIKFHKSGVINDAERIGTSIPELLKVCEDKLKLEAKEPEVDFLRATISNYLKTVKSNNGYERQLST